MLYIYMGLQISIPELAFVVELGRSISYLFSCYLFTGVHSLCLFTLFYFLSIQFPKKKNHGKKENCIKKENHKKKVTQKK